MFFLVLIRFCLVGMLRKDSDLQIRCIAAKMGHKQDLQSYRIILINTKKFKLFASKNYFKKILEQRPCKIYSTLPFFFIDRFWEFSLAEKMELS